MYKRNWKELEGIGGKWNRKAKGFIFPTDPSVLLGRVKEGENINLKKEFQFFATPPDLAMDVVVRADIQPGDTIFEPSCGTGAFLTAIAKVTDEVVDVCELMENNRVILGESGLKYNMIAHDFLEVPTSKKYYKIIANPPFSKNQDILHVRKMYDHLEIGGKLTTIMSKHWQQSSNKKETAFRDWLEEQNHFITEVDGGAFSSSGTQVATVVVEIWKD